MHGQLLKLKKYISSRTRQDLLQFVVLTVLLLITAGAARASLSNPYEQMGVAPEPTEPKATVIPVATSLPSASVEPVIARPTPVKTQAPVPTAKAPIICTSERCSSYTPPSGSCADYVCCSLTGKVSQPMLKADCDKQIAEADQTRIDEAKKTSDALLQAQRERLEAQTKAFQDKLARDEQEAKDAQAIVNANAEQQLQSTIAANAAGYTACVSEVKSWYGRQLNILGANGVADSSYAIEVEQQYYNYLSQCDSNYQPRQ